MRRTGPEGAGAAIATSRMRGRLAVALTVAAIGLAACSSDDYEGETTQTPDATASDPEVDSHLTTPAGGDREPILIKTRFNMFAGKVLAGSVIGDSPFCPGGTTRDGHGSVEIGYPAIRTFRCPDGQLKIGFGPGPDQMNSTVQTSSWKILEGSGSLEGMSGSGRWVGKFERLGSTKGQDTLTGTVVVP